MTAPQGPRRDPGMFDPDITGGAVVWVVLVCLAAVIAIGVAVLAVTL